MPINDVQTTNRQHAVPQNIMDVEFKIIGDLTMRQFIYLMVFGAMAYGAFAGINNFFKWPLVIVLVLTGIGFAFVPLQERGLDEWFINFFKSMYSPTQRIWKKEAEIPAALSMENLAVVKQELITLTPTSSRRKLEDFLEHQELEAPIDPLDISEYEYVEKLRSVFQSTAAIEPAIVQSTTYDSNDTGSAITTTLVEEPAIELPDVAVTPPAVPPTPPAKTPPPEQTAQEPTKPKIEEPIQPKPPELKKEPQRKKLMTALLPSKKEDKQSYKTRAITPDRHSGRKFTNLLPQQGEIVLPIRGERILKTADEEKIQGDIEEKASQLRKLLDQIKTDEQYSDKIKAQPPKPNPATGTPQETKQNVATPAIATAPIPQIEKPAGMPAPVPPTPEPTVPAQPANINPLSSKPNIISGVVKDSAGNPLEGVVVIIKNDKEEPVRGIKTNQLGQFVISTALSNGTYTLLTDKANKTNLTFDIINFEATGTVLAPVDIVGK